MALISITGQLVNPIGSGISGAYVTFTSNATTDGSPTVTKQVDASFVTDASGFYSSQLMSPGWYKIDLLRPDWLAPQKLGVGILDGTETSPIDLSDLLYSALPLPMKLQNISDINVSTRVDGSFLAWDNASQRWLCAPPLTGFSQVDVASRVSGSVLEWNPAASKWVASPHRADGQLYQSFTQSGTVGAQSDLMYTSIPANTMSANGDRLRAAGVFSTVASGEKCIKAYFGSTLIADVSHYNFNTPSRPVHVFGEVIITRTAAATQNVFSRFWDETHWLSAGTIEFSPPPVYNVSAFTGVSLTLSSANTFKFNASGAGTDDIVQKEMLIEYLPAP